jgi:glycosyltransferase involved in cell wall biosynthesis
VWICFLAYQAALAGVILANALWLRRRAARPAPLDRFPSLTVIIPARNEETNLRRLLPTLLAQRYPAFDVLVYDDASEDGTAEVVRRLGDGRVRLLRGDGPPPGWVGKVHALAEASAEARGELILFLDADAELLRPDALDRLVARFNALPGDATLSGLPHLVGGGTPLVSAIPYIFLSALPLPLVPRLRLPLLSAMNGQFWMIARRTYERLQPHRRHPDEVMEDVVIGRYLTRQGVTVWMEDLQDDLAVHMYGSLGDAWRGLRKNIYLGMGGTPLIAVPLFALYVVAAFGPLLVSPWFLLSYFVLKGLADRVARQPLRATLLAPLTFVLLAVLAADSAVSHWTGTARWKGRRVVRGA